MEETKKVDLYYGLYLTRSNDDGIFLHFDDGERHAAVKIDNHGPEVWKPTALKWAEQALQATKETP